MTLVELRQTKGPVWAVVNRTEVVRLAELEVYTSPPAGARGTVWPKGWSKPDPESVRFVECRNLFKTEGEANSEAEAVRRTILEARVSR